MNEQAKENQALKRAREHKGWTQAELAEKIGSTPLTVYRWERRRSIPSLHFRRKLCDVLETTPEQLDLLPAQEQQLASPDLSAPLSPPSESRKLLPPFTPGHLIGRETLLDDLKRRLSSTPPFLAIRGLPGVGKTALALALIHDPALHDLFPDGVLWASVGPHPPLLAHLQHWGWALGWAANDLAALQDQSALGKALQVSIEQRQMLLIMDDIWQVEDALALKIGGPRCTHLATTRLQIIAHHLAAEHTLAVPELDDDDSLTLLQCLAPASIAGYPDAIRSLVGQVGGLPLALQLIGHALRVQELSGQPRRIERTIQQLQYAEARLTLAQASAPTDTPPTLQAGTPLSLKAVITVSVQRLTPRTQTLLQALAVFPARPISFSEEAALGVSDLTRQEFLDALDALLDTSLIESAGPERYTMHLTIADFARFTHPNFQQIQERYVRYYAARVQACQDDYPCLDEEFQHLSTMFQLAYDLQLWDALIPAILAFSPFGLARGFYTLLATHLKQALSGAEQLQDDQHRCNLLNALADTAESQGDYAASQAYAEQALELAHQLQSPPAISKALHLLGLRYLHAGKTQPAQAYLEEALAIATQIGNDDRCARILVCLGRLMTNTGNHQEAEVLLQRGLVIVQRHQWHERMVGIYGNLGVLSAVQGQLAQAEHFFTEALAEARRVGWRAQIALELINLGATALERGDLENAERLLTEGLAVARDIRSQEKMFIGIENLGEIALYQKSYEQAEQYIQECVQIAREIGYVEGLAASLHKAGLIACCQQKFVEAQAFQQEGLAIARAAAHQRNICLLLQLQGEIALHQGHFALATAAFQEALALAEARHYQALKGEALFGLAQVLQGLGEVVQAQAKGLEAFHFLQAIHHRRMPEVQHWLETLTPTPAESEEPLR